MLTLVSQLYPVLESPSLRCPRAAINSWLAAKRPLATCRERGWRGCERNPRTWTWTDTTKEGREETLSWLSFSNKLEATRHRHSQASPGAKHLISSNDQWRIFDLKLLRSGYLGVGSKWRLSTDFSMHTDGDEKEEGPPTAEYPMTQLSVPELNRTLSTLSLSRCLSVTDPLLLHDCLVAFTSLEPCLESPIGSLSEKSVHTPGAHCYRNSLLLCQIQHLLPWLAGRWRFPP